MEEARDEDWDTDGSVLRISTAEEMAQFCYLTNLGSDASDYVDFAGKTIKLTDDIDLSAYTEWPGIYLAEDVTFDGNEHTVTVNIQDFPNGDDYTGATAPGALFSQTDPGSILKNLKADGEITKSTSPNMVSVGLIGTLLGKAENCTSSIDFVFANAGGNAFIGGIAGVLAVSGEITNCVFDGKILVENILHGSEIGGIAGFANQGTVSISCCENRGTIITHIMNFSNIGGILGLSADIDRTEITNCLFAGEIIYADYESYSDLNIGGILARNSLYDSPSEANILNCLSSGTITFPNTDSLYAGAVFGYTPGVIDPLGYIMTTIKNCYFTPMGDDIDIVYDREDEYLTLDGRSGKADVSDEDFVDMLNEGQDEEYWWIGEDGITCLLKPEEDEEEIRPSHSYSLEERKSDSNDEKEPEITEDDKVTEEAEITDIIGHWAEPYIRQVISGKYMNTITETQFFPDSPATRLTVADALYALSGDEYSGEKAPFTDTASESVNWLYFNKITAGFEDNTFRPNDTITREQLAVMIYNYMASIGKDVSNIEGMAIYEFSDYDEISEWARTAIRYCINSGIFTGNPDGTFNPKGNITRAELAVLINNISNM